MSSNVASLNPEDDIDKTRKVWDSQAEYLLSCIGFAVGLGNIWRFAYLVESNGGGAFLIPYFVMLLVEGIPLQFLELTMGQRIRLGPLPLYRKVSPYASGVGMAMCMVSLLIGLFYNVVLSWCAYYFFASWQDPLPWANCPTQMEGNVTVEIEQCAKIGAPMYYWYYEALEIGTSLDDRDGLNWALTLVLLLMWIIVVLSMIRGIATSGKVVYFTVIFPYIVLIILFVRGLTLDGAGDGVRHMFRPDWEKLKDAKVWLTAAAQIFFTLSVGFGGDLAYSSYNPINEKPLGDALVICFVNCGTSIFAGVGVFSVLGFRAHNLQTACLERRPGLINVTLAERFPNTMSYSAEQIKNVTEYWIGQGEHCDKSIYLSSNTGGTGLAFVAMAEALNQMPASIFFSLIFFLMMVTLGLDSMYGSLECVTTSLRDIKWVKDNVREELVIVIVAVPLFFIALCFTGPSGEYVLQIFNSFAVDYALLIIGASEAIFVVYVYGLRRVRKDLIFMCGEAWEKAGAFFYPFWAVFSPGGCIVMLIAFIVMNGKTLPQYEIFDTVEGKAYKVDYPGWAIFIAVLLVLISVIWIPLGVAYGFYIRRIKGEEDPNDVVMTNPNAIKTTEA